METASHDIFTEEYYRKKNNSPQTNSLNPKNLKTHTNGFKFHAEAFGGVVRSVDVLLTPERRAKLNKKIDKHE